MSLLGVFFDALTCRRECLSALDKSIYSSVTVGPRKQNNEDEFLPLKDCSGWLKKGFKANGVYTIKLNASGEVNVHCDMKTDGGGKM